MGNETSSTPPTPSETPTSEQLSVLSVSSRRKSSVGSNLQQTPEDPPEPDLSNLTEEEIAQINSVILRAKEMQEEEEERVRRLEEDYASYAQSVVQKRSEAEQESKGRNLCPICNKVELLLREDGTRDGQNACVDCERVVCDECGLYETSLATKLQEWVCHICQRRRRLVLSTGLWYHGFHPGQERGPVIRGLDPPIEGASVEDGERPALARSTSVNGYKDVSDEKRPKITRQVSLPSDMACGGEKMSIPTKDASYSALGDVAEESKSSQGHSRLKGVGQGTKSDSEDMSDFASDVDMEDLTAQRVRGDGSSLEDVSDEYSLMSIVSTTTDDTEDYFRISRRPRPRSLNLSRSHSATSSDDDTEYTEYSGAKLSDEEADLNFEAEAAPDHEEFRRALEGLSAMAEEHDDLDDFPPSMHVSIPRTHSLSMARAENGQFEARQVYSPSPPRSPSWREGLESPPFSPRRKDSYPGKRRSISSPVSPKDKRHFFTYTDMSPPSRQISLDELYGEDHAIGEPNRLHGAMNTAQRPSPLSPEEVRESFTSNSGEQLQLDKPVKAKKNGDSDVSLKSRKYKDHDSIGVVDLASFAATVASNTASLTSMSVSPTNLRVVEDLHHTDQLSPDSLTSTDSTSPGSPGYSDDHSYSEEVDDIELADPATKPIDYQNTKRQKQRPPSTSADWSPVVDLSPILDVSPSVEEAEQEDMLAQQEALRMRMEKVSRVGEDDENDERVEKVEFIDGDDDHDYQELNLVRGGSDGNGDDDEFMITPLKRYHNIEDMSQIDNGNLYEKAEAFGSECGFDEDRHHLPVLYELPELCATSNFDTSSKPTVTYSSVQKISSGEDEGKVERVPERGMEMITYRRSGEMETIPEINGNVTGWANDSSQIGAAVAPIPVPSVSSPSASNPRASTCSPSMQSTPSPPPGRVRRKLPKPTPEIVATQKKPSPLKPATLTAWLSSSLARTSAEESVTEEPEKHPVDTGDSAEVKASPAEPTKVSSRVEMFEKLGSSQDEDKELVEKPEVAPKPHVLVKQDSMERKRAKDLKAKPNPLVIKHIESEEQTMSPQYKVMESPVTPEGKSVRRDYSESSSLTPTSSPEHDVHIYPSPVTPLDSDSSPPKPQSPSTNDQETDKEKFSFPVTQEICVKEPVPMVDKPPAPVVQPRPVKAERAKTPAPIPKPKAPKAAKPKPPPVKEKPKRIRRRLPSVPSAESSDESVPISAGLADDNEAAQKTQDRPDKVMTPKPEKQSSSKTHIPETSPKPSAKSSGPHKDAMALDGHVPGQKVAVTGSGTVRARKTPNAPEHSARGEKVSKQTDASFQKTIPKSEPKSSGIKATARGTDRKSSQDASARSATPAGGKGGAKPARSSPLPAKRKVQILGPTAAAESKDDTEVSNKMKEAADKEVKRIIEEAEQYCRNNGVTEDVQKGAKGTSVSKVIAEFEEKQRPRETPTRLRRFPVEKDVDMILRDEIGESDLLIDSLKSIYGVPITSAMKSLKRRIIEELKSATMRRRKQLEELEEIKALEYQIEQLKLAKLGEAMSKQKPVPAPRGGRRTLAPSESRQGQVVHRTRSESPARRTTPSRSATDISRKGQRSMSPSRTSPQVPQRRSRHRRQASDPSIVKFSPIKEDKDIEAAFQAKLDEPAPEKRLERYPTDDSSQSGQSDAESTRSEPMNSRYKKVKPSAYAKMFYSGKSMSVDRLQPDYCTYSGSDRLSLLESVSDPHLADGRSAYLKSNFPDDDDPYDREERKYILQMEINKRKRQLEETARLQHELMRLSRDPDTLYHSYDDIPIQYRSHAPNRPIPTGIIKPLDDETPQPEVHTPEDYRLYQELLAGYRPVDVYTTAQANYSSTEYLAHKQEEFRRQTYDDYTQYDDIYADDVKYREQRTRDWVPRHDRLDALAYPSGNAGREGVMSSSTTLPDIYSHRSDVDFVPTREAYVIYHSDTDTNSPASDFTPAMPLLDDVTTRSRKIIHSIGSRPNSAEFNFPGGVEDLLNAIHRVESDNSVDADEPIMKHMTEGGVTILKQLERKKQPPPTEPRKYTFPTKRILLTRDPRERSIRGNGIGMKIVGGKRYPGTHDLVAYVQAIYPGGVAEQLHGELQEGDQIVEWNGVPLTGRTYEDVQHIISIPNGEIELLIRPGTRLSTKLATDCCRKSSSAPGSCHSSYDNLDDVRDLDDFDPCYEESRGIDPDQLAAQLEGIQEATSPVASPTSSQPDYTTPSMSSPCSTPRSEPVSTTSERNRLASERAPVLDSTTEMGDIQLQLSYDDYDNTLNIHIIQARNLLPKDMNGLSDPFVKVYLLPGRNPENKRRTKHIPRSLNPEWHQTIMFQDVPRDEIRRRVLEFTVWDYDRFKANDFLGEVVIDLSDDGYLDNRPHWYPLSDHDENTSAELPKPTVLPPSHDHSTMSKGKPYVTTGKAKGEKTQKEPVASEEMFSQGLGRRKSLGNLLEVDNKREKKSMHAFVSHLLCCTRRNDRVTRAEGTMQPIFRPQGHRQFQLTAKKRSHRLMNIIKTRSTDS